MIQLPQTEQTAIKALSSASDATGKDLKMSKFSESTEIGKNQYLFIHFGGKGLATHLYPMLSKAFSDKKCYHLVKTHKTVVDINKLVFEVWREGE